MLKKLVMGFICFTVLTVGVNFMNVPNTNSGKLSFASSNVIVHLDGGLRMDTIEL